MFHGVGRDNHPLFIEEDEFRALIERLDTERGAIWTAPVVDVAQHLKEPTG